MSVFSDEPQGSDGDWISITEEALPIDLAQQWVILPNCGAVVTFLGVVRDHTEGRSGVISLDYEAYIEQAGKRMHEIAAKARESFPELGRIIMWHRIGHLEVTEPSVVVSVSSMHRSAAFNAARYCIDTIKSSVPIWKRETWSGGSDWSENSKELTEIGDHSTSAYSSTSLDPSHG